MESLAGSTPTARVQALFPYLPTFRERATELEAQVQRQSVPNGRELDDEALAARKLEYEYFGSFLEFLEEEYVPWQKKLDSLHAQGMIVFELIWALFQPGMKVRVLHGPSGEHTAARIIRGEQVEHLNERVSRNSIPQIWGPFRLYGETVDWKENKYTHTPWKFEISRFKGPRMISALPAVELTAEEMIEFQERGQQFAIFAKEQHVERA
ncbi:hypothetical protein BS47DRAFT_46388 [Hydnum rufescens UP504]|uniref:DUF7025 domain-containing protein n=1 Tax=Hydnum rufescens UP504 TaxID=1448309 RepID=A0A9P6DTM3_9AGAM|nr:hypothetical protein BS47DRAFT_46388 [Hydnum rufescens UP504]